MFELMGNPKVAFSLALIAVIPMFIIMLVPLGIKLRNAMRKRFKQSESKADDTEQ